MPIPRHIIVALPHTPQSADRAHDSRQQELLSQLSHCFAALASELQRSSPPPVYHLPLSQGQGQGQWLAPLDLQRMCELEQEVEQLKLSIASQALLSSLRASVGGTADTSAAAPPCASDLPQLQVWAVFVWMLCVLCPYENCVLIIVTAFEALARVQGCV